MDGGNQGPHGTETGGDKWAPGSSPQFHPRTPWRQSGIRPPFVRRGMSGQLGIQLPSPATISAGSSARPDFRNRSSPQRFVSRGAGNSDAGIRPPRQRFPRGTRPLAPDGSPNVQNEQPPVRQRICTYFISDICILKDNCRYLHELPPVVPVANRGEGTPNQVTTAAPTNPNRSANLVQQDVEMEY